MRKKQKTPIDYVREILLEAIRENDRQNGVVHKAEVIDIREYLLQKDNVGDPRSLFTENQE